MSKNILILPGDGIGHEICAVAKEVLQQLATNEGLDINISEAAVGGTSYDMHGTPLTEAVLHEAKQADAILLGAVGGTQWESLDISVRPEKALLSLRKELDLFANLRPAILHKPLADASSLKPELVADLDILIVRELTGGIYFGQPRGVATDDSGRRYGYNTYIYNEDEIRRIAHVAFQSAQMRNGKLCSVDKANVLEVTELWREIVTDVAREYPDVELSHMYVDNAAMQLVREPKQFDVILTGNMFGDILSDTAAMLTGSIGMLPSASLNSSGVGMYEPVHGSAPDIAGQNKANPLATILSVAMLLRYSLSESAAADRLEQAVINTLNAGYRTVDIAKSDDTVLGTKEMGQAVIQNLNSIKSGS
ncbi:MAG: 3-isopropylmalate dehydrogenase [Gammaproteobacteria bacterium]